MNGQGDRVTGCLIRDWQFSAKCSPAPSASITPTGRTRHGLLATDQLL